MKFDAVYAISLLASFSHFITYSFQSPSLSGSSSKAVAELTEDNKYWYPEIGRAQEYQTTFNSFAIGRTPPGSKGNEPQRSSWLKLPKWGNSAGRPTNKGAVEYGPKLSHNEFSKLYFDNHVRKVEGLSTYFVHVATQKLWNNPSIKPEEFDGWLNFLKEAVKKDESVTAEVPIAVLYSFASLRIKFFGQEFYPNILAAEPAVRKFATGGFKGELEELPWGRELLNPSKGFSNQLKSGKSLEGLVASGSDDTFKSALGTDMRKSIAALRTITTEFGTYNSYKRVVALAIYFQSIKTDRWAELNTIPEFRKLVGNNVFLPHENELVKYIAGETHIQELNSIQIFPS